jgi:hypothetical protein
MAGLSGALTAIVVSRLTSTTTGVNVLIGATDAADFTLQAGGIQNILALNASVEISEKTGSVQYPALLVYCDKLSNTLKEKFRQFSGSAHVVVEVRHSQDVLAGIESNAEVYVDAVCSLLDASRGDWGGGLFYTGGYDVSYETVGRGGRNFLQRAKVGFDVEVSK